MSSQDMPFGDWIRRRRKQLDLTQEDLAHQVACSVSTIRKIESSERRPSRQVTLLLAETLKIPPNQREAFLKAARAMMFTASNDALDQADFYTSEDRTITTNLPMPVTDFVGREFECEKVRKLLGDPTCKLITLTGPGGIGKTRLAIQIAVDLHDIFPDGIYFIPLLNVTAAEHIPKVIAGAIGLTESIGSDSTQLIINYLRNRQILLVLDNMEQLISHTVFTADATPHLSGAEVLVEILQTSPRVKIMTTSRERLNFRNEWVFEVHGLPVPPEVAFTNPERFSSVHLFSERARQSRTDFALTADDQRSVVRICQLVDGMPLAIEMAAAWVRVLSCGDIAAEIERSLDFLTASARDMPKRHSSIRVVLNQSWDMLTVDEQLIMNRLSMFRGGMDLDAARNVAGVTLHSLADLISKSLVMKNADSRFDMHPLIRQYAQEQLLASGAWDEIADAHLRYFVALAETLEPKLRGSEQTKWLHHLELNHDNIQAALEWALSDNQRQPTAALQALRLAGALYLYWRRRGHWTEGRDWLRLSLARASRYPLTRERMKAANTSVLLAAEQADTASSWEFAQENLCDARELCDSSSIAQSLYALGFLMYKMKELKGARSTCEESLQLFRNLGERLSAADVLHNLIHICISQADYVAALSSGMEAADIYRELGDTIGLEDVLSDLGLIAYLHNDYETAGALLPESLARLREAASVPGTVAALSRLGDLARAQGDYDQADAFYLEGLTMYRDMGDRDELPSMWHNHAYVLLHRGSYAEALDLFTEALKAHQETENLGGIAECVAGISAVLARQGHFVHSIRLLSVSETIRNSIASELWPADRAEHHKTLKILRDSLDDSHIRAIQVEGAALASSGINAVVAAAMHLA